MMFISQDTSNTPYLIRSYQPGAIKINQTVYENSLIISNHTLLSPWPVSSIADLTEETLAPLFTLDPEVIIIGTGEKAHFPPPEQLQLLIAKKIGYEFMSTAAACHTFTVLCAEGRKVVAGLIV